jgi:REP element-mobilizing transposase RayT
VVEALRHFDGERIAQIAWVVMPNHVDAVFVLNSASLLENIILRWKGFTARKINANCIRYIRRNPEKARLRNGEFILYESEFAKNIE